MKGRWTITLGLAGLVPLLLLFLVGPFLVADPQANDLLLRLQAPGPGHLLGTDHLGRDVLARVAVGGRLSCLIGLGCALVSVGFGTAAGLLAGLRGGITDTLIMRGVEFLFAIPSLLIAVALSLTLPPGALGVIVALAVVSWAAPARIVRSLTVGLVQRPFVEAATAMGVGAGRLAMRHLLPNLISPVFIMFSIGVAAAILGESTLSFLGLGVPPPAPTLGGMILQGQDYLGEAPWIALTPGLLLALLVLAVNFLGDGLRDLLDPHFRP